MKSRVLAESRCHRRGVHRIVASPEEPSEAFGDADMAEVKEAAERMRLELPFDCRRLCSRPSLHRFEWISGFRTSEELADLPNEPRRANEQ